MAKSLEDVAHYFFSDDAPTRSPEVEHPARTIGVLSLLDSVPPSSLVASLAIQLTKSRHKVMAAQLGSPGGISLHSILGLNRPFIPIENYLKGETVVTLWTGHRGIRLLPFPLDASRFLLLKSIAQGRLFRSLLREEQRSDLFVLSIGHDAPMIEKHLLMQEATELLLLLPGKREKLKSVFRIIKTIFQWTGRKEIGVILLSQDDSSEDSSNSFEALSRATSVLEGRSTLKDYGRFTLGKELYQLLLRGKPLDSSGPAREYSFFLSALASKLSKEALKTLPARPQNISLFEAFVGPARIMKPYEDETLLSHEEERFLV